jgi:ABC-type sugar transport system ATPase subunit
MSDRILVMRDGTIGGELPPESSEAEIILVATGHDNNQNPTMLDESKEEVI